MATPTPGYQITLNAPSYVDMVDRYWLRSGDDRILSEFWPSIKKSIILTMNLRPESGPDGIVSVPSGNINPPYQKDRGEPKPGMGLDWFEGDEWYGMTPHVGGIHLATLRMAERMANVIDDKEFLKLCKEWIAAGSNSMETKLWTGRYYLNYYEPETGKKSELIFAYQLDGEWMTRFHGLEGVFAPERIGITLNSIRENNVRLTKYGAVNFANPDGTPAKGVGYGPYSMFPPEVLMLSMLYMYNHEFEFGMEIARRHWHDIVCERCHTWDQPNILRGDEDTGEFVYGHDYYQNMMLWSLPAAMEMKDLRHVLRKDGLVERIINAAHSHE
jgi:uncharacterized protein (DUF608 family)